MLCAKRFTIELLHVLIHTSARIRQPEEFLFVPS